MSNVSRKEQSKQKSVQAEFYAGRVEWSKKYDSCCKKITDDLGYDLSTFAEAILNNHENLASHAEAIELQNQFKQLLEQKKILWPEEAIVEKLNKKHAIVHAGQTYVLTEKNHPVFGGTDFSLESRQSFRMYYEDEVVLCSDGKKKSKADIWLKSPLRRKYENIIFDPTISAQSAEGKKLYNLWKGFAIEPEKGDCSKYWKHVENNICAGNNEASLFVRKWLAYVFQHPDKVHTALIICGSQGVGKNSFVEPLGVLLGSHYVPLSNISELVSNFNFHLKNAVLIHANEAFWGGHKKDLGTLKSMITEETCLIEGKGKDTIQVRNYKHVIISSNEAWPVHLDPDDRRFFVLCVSEKHKEDTAYFRALQDELNNGGYEALLYDLLHEDLEGFNPRRFPSSIHAFDVKMIGASSVQRFVFDLLRDDHPSLSTSGYIPKKELYREYKDWCTENEEKTVRNNAFGKELKKLIPSIKDHRDSSGGKREWMYDLPGFKKARAEFCRAFKVPDTIWEEERPSSSKNVLSENGQEKNKE